jgi:hypothetical protein
MHNQEIKFNDEILINRHLGLTNKIINWASDKILQLENLGLKRDKINYNKKLALQFCNDKSYKENTYVIAQLFPFDFDVIETSRPHRLKRIELDVDQKLYNKLKAIGSILGHSDVRTTVKLFLEKSVKLWEE